ncbi:hypothetical protein ACFY1U_39000 [Streptomyces sp. NPDC001351]|uniref:hypothetical protein n=1 Tax=Streptomyces sp. NPDC001351 TaxID=3364564 RepID=UPI0036BE6196
MEQREQHAEGVGPFTTRLTWRVAGGGEAVWESRPVRRRGVLTLRPPGEAGGRHARADEVSARRMRRLNAVAAIAFVIGGALFSAGAAVAQFGSGDATECASVYFVGGLFFTTGGYASLLQVINAPRHVIGGTALVGRRWRWWSFEPTRVDWLSVFLLFAGTLVFGVNLLNSFLPLGSGLFMVSALAAYTRPATDSPVNIDVANWGTLTGAQCFSVGGALQMFERP